MGRICVWREEFLYNNQMQTIKFNSLKDKVEIMLYDGY